VSEGKDMKAINIYAACDSEKLIEACVKTVKVNQENMRWRLSLMQ
jgi:hypothetical protein